jgi:hypothetical protein
MYDYIQEAIDKGECLLEWDEAHEARPPPVPLLKDKFGGERRKAKVRVPHLHLIQNATAAVSADGSVVLVCYFALCFSAAAFWGLPG